VVGKVARSEPLEEAYLSLRKRQIEKEEGFDLPIEGQPEEEITIMVRLPWPGNGEGVQIDTRHLMNHSAIYSKATNVPTMDQYIAHRFSSASEWGRWLTDFHVAKHGSKNANQALRFCQTMP
jgi:hypothetical protein